MKEEYEAKLHEVKKEAEEILEDARKRAKQREAEIIAEAREEADRIVTRATARWNWRERKRLMI